MALLARWPRSWLAGLSPFAGPRRRFGTRVSRGNTEPDLNFFVGNIPPAWASADLRGAFAAKCYVRTASVHVKQRTSEFLGFGFLAVAVDESNAEDISAAVLEMDGQVFDGFALIVKIAGPSRADSTFLNEQLIKAPLAGHILDLFDHQGAGFTASNLATAFHHLGLKYELNSLRTDANALRTLKKLESRVAESAGADSRKWLARHIANTALGAARIHGFEAPALFDVLADEAQKRLRTFNPQHLANLAWGFAAAGFETPLLFEAISKEALVKLHEWEERSVSKTDPWHPRDVANLAWAFAKAGIEAPLLFDAVAAEALTKIEKFEAQDVKTLAWAFSTAKIEAPKLIEALKARHEEIEALKARHEEIEALKARHEEIALKARHEDLSNVA